jgi:DNA end-binding protein Ku
MEPTKGGAKAYTLLRDALRDTGKVGIAKVVIKTRQYLAAVKPNDKGLALELMHFADELVDAGEMHLPDKAGVNKGEMEMAKTLIERMTDSWKPEKYTDDYRAALLELIEKKIETGGKETPTPKARAKKATNVIDLVDVLRQSLGETGKKKQKRAEHTKHKKAA